MGVLPTCVYVNHTRAANLVPVEVRRMHWIPWNWSCIGGVSHHGGTENQTCVFPQKQKVFLTTELYITDLLFGYLQQKSQSDFSLVKEIKDNLDFFLFYLVKGRY